MVALSMLTLLGFSVCLVLLVVSAIRKKTKRYWVIGMVSCSILFISSVIALGNSTNNRYEVPALDSSISVTNVPAQPYSGDGVVRVTFGEIMNDCSNEIAFDLKYKGKIVQVSDCVVQQVSSTANPRVTVSSRSLFSGSFTCDFSTPIGLESLYKGQTVTIRGYCRGVFLGDPDLKDCSIVR
jgi:hypothetical protein